MGVTGGFIRREDEDEDEDEGVNLRLSVVFHGHGDHVDADDAGDEQVQVVVVAQCVDGEAEGRVVVIVGLLLSLCAHTHTQHDKSSCQHRGARAHSHTGEQAPPIKHVSHKAKHHRRGVKCLSRVRGQILQARSLRACPTLLWFPSMHLSLTD